MSQDCYSLLSPDRIRLLRLLPNADERAGIQCELFEYSLQESGKGTHLYEALSYVWGGSDDPRSISVDGYDLPVTANLHAVLSRLRDRNIVRILWVDAVCINQANKKEKGHQVQSMAKIFGQAHRVIVWLGEAADNSDRAVEEIRLTAGKQSTNSSNEEPIQQAILALLQRPWFRRIWVLQEVAAARHIMIMCGSMEIDGFAFCLGVDSLKDFYKDLPDLQSLIRSVTYLIRGAIFRPRYATSRSGTASLDICPLGELIDMYHTHEATFRHDKVYALLGMSSDNLGKASLSPEYGVPWEELLERLIKFILCEKVSVETHGDRREMAIIKTKGCILGQVSSVKGDSTRYDSQDVDVVFNNTPRSLEYEKECGARWSLQVSAKPIREGDLVCLLEGVSKPTIIRLCKDHFAIIMIAVSLQQYVEPLALTKRFSYDFLLVWNWEKSLGNFQDQARYETSAEINTLVPGHLNTAPNKAARLCDVAQVLGDLKKYGEAEKRLQEAIKGCEGAFEKENPHVLIYKSEQQLKKAEDLFLQVIQIRKHVQGMDHQDTLGSIANLTSIYLDQYDLDTWDQEMVTSLTDRIRDNVQITEEEIVWVIRSFDKDIISFLLELKSDIILVTEEVVKAAAKTNSGKEVMTLLLDQYSTKVKITEEIVKVAAGNWRSGQEIMELLLNRCSTEVKITEEVVKAAAGNKRSGKEVMTLLLDQCSTEVKITEEVVKAAAGNGGCGKEVMTLLFDRRSTEVKITEEVVKAAAENENSGKEVITLLLNQRSTEAKVTEEVVKAAARNYNYSKEVMTFFLDQHNTKVKITEAVAKVVAENWDSSQEVMALLYDQRNTEVKITEEVVKAAARNMRSGKEVMTLLLDRCSTEVKITEEVVKAAAGNRESGKEVMTLLLDRRSTEVKITEEIVKAAAGNKGSGKEVMRLLLDRCSTEVKITEEVVKAAAGNKGSGKEVMRLLLDRCSTEVKITEEVVKVAAGNWRSGQEVMTLLLDQRSTEVKITEEVVKAAAGNRGSGKEVMALLLNRCSTEVKITEEVVKAAAGNGGSGKEVMALLLNQCSTEVKITEEVVKAAAGNGGSGKKVMALLLNRRSTEVKITEEVVKAAAENEISGKEVITLLLDQCSTEVKIIEEVVKAAARNYNYGKEVMALLLD